MVGRCPGLVSMIFVLVQPSAPSACLRAPQMDIWPQLSDTGKKLLPLTVNQDAPAGGHTH